MNEQIEKKAEELLAKMTLREKIGQLHQVGYQSRSLSESNREALRKGEIGSLLYTLDCKPDKTPEDAAASRAYLNELQRIAVEESRLGIPLLIGKDVIHGHHTVFPIPLAQAACFDPEVVRGSYEVIAKEAVNDGIHWSFAPMMDLSRDPRWGRCVEGYGEDPRLSSEMAAAAVRGFQGDDLSKRESMAACAKHYIGYGAMEGGRDYSKSELSDYTLRNYYLPAFKSAIDAGVATVMSSYNEISGQPTTSSHYLMTELLRDELGFDGFVVSDYDAVKQLRRQGVAADDADAAVAAVSAGVDMDMGDGLYISTLEKEVLEGRLDEKIIDEACRRVLRIKFRLGLFEHPYATFEEPDHEANKAAALRAAEGGMVLLKNENDALPLAKDEIVGLAGDFVSEKQKLLGAWTLDGVVEWTKSLEEAVRDIVGADKVVCNAADNLSDRYQSVMECDTVVLALGGFPEGEASGRAMLEIPDDQKTLIAMAKQNAKKVIGVFFYGRPMALGEVEPLLDGIIWAWHAGTMTGVACADLLFGNANPSGKLPMSFPRCTGQIPVYYNCTPGCRRIDEYYPREKKGGYRNYRDVSGAPLYPFGYGLSYTTFAYSGLCVDKAERSLDEINSGGKFTVSVTVKNTGAVAGREAAQCYIRDMKASMMRPLRQLAGFEKVMLAPGEEKTVSFTLGLDELGFYGRDGKFAAEKGDFTVFVGTDSYADHKLAIKLI